ncbi:MAG: SPFH domain-containing protein [Flavobacteriales bacterium]|nr:SPFH domain-containing protein [Flavobacteriales bacterium]
MDGFSISTTVFSVLSMLFLFNAIFTVKQKTAVVIERLGKFLRVAEPGLQFKIPIIDQKAGLVNLRVMELPVEIETKTKDDVFVRLIVSVQYFVTGNPEGIRKAHYQFDNPGQQIQSYVFDSIRSEVPKLILDEVFSEKDRIANAVRDELTETISEFGFEIIKALVTDIDPDSKVKNSMNEINAAKRMKEAAKEYAEAEKIKVVTAAEAEAQSKKLQGEGIANQRIAIANGLKHSVEEVKGAMEDGVSGQQVMNMLFMTQHYDTISRLSEGNVSTIFMPYSPSSVGSLQSEIQSGLLGVDMLKEAKAKQEKEEGKGQA